jgi:hypothetical protein
MSMRTLLAGSLVCLALGSPTWAGDPPPGPGGPPETLTPKKASAMLKKEIASHLKFQKGELGSILKEVCGTIKEIENSLKDDSFSVDDLMDGAINEMGIFLSDVNNLHNTVVNQINFDAEQLLISLQDEAGIPDAFLQDSCNTLDKGLAKAQKATDAAVAKIRKKLKALNKKSQKKQDVALASCLASPDPVAIAPNPEEVAPAAFKDLKADAMISSSDGQICIAGQFSGEPGVSVDVTVTLGGEDFTLTAETDGCRWNVCFKDGEGLDAPLDRGNYIFEIREFDVDGTLDSICEGFGVP